MFPTELLEIFGTLSVGLLCIAGATALAWVAQNTDDRFGEWYGNIRMKPTKEGFVLPLAFFFGMLEVLRA